MPYIEKPDLDALKQAGDALSEICGITLQYRSLTPTYRKRITEALVRWVRANEHVAEASNGRKILNRDRARADTALKRQFIPAKKRGYQAKND